MRSFSRIPKSVSEVSIYLIIQPETWKSSHFHPLSLGILQLLFSSTALISNLFISQLPLSVSGLLQRHLGGLLATICSPGILFSIFHVPFWACPGPQGRTSTSTYPSHSTHVPAEGFLEAELPDITGHQRAAFSAHNSPVPVPSSTFSSSPILPFSVLILNFQKTCPCVLQIPEGSLHFPLPVA